MQRKKSLIIIGIIAAAIIVGGGAAVIIVAGGTGGTGGTVVYPYIPTALPDQTILSNLKDVKEVKAFLNKYPNAKVWVERSVREVDVFYKVDNSNKYPNATIKWDSSSTREVFVDNNGTIVGEYDVLMLSVYLHKEGKPQEMYIQCIDDTRTPRDILKYIETETCLTKLPEQTILSNLKDVKEVKAFLDKYPNATMMVDRSGGGLEVVYTVDNSSKYPNATIKWDDSSGKDIFIDNEGNKIGEHRSLQLRVFLDDEGKKPRDIWLNCYGKIGFPIFNIVNYIETETCLD